MPSFTDLDLSITPVGGSLITLKGLGEISGPVNNVVSFSFDELYSDFATLLSGVAVENVEHHRNRAAAYQVVYDPVGKFCEVSYKEVHPYDPTLADKYPTRTHNGVIVISGQGNSPLRSSMRLTLYIANYWRERGTGLKGSVV